MNDSVTHRTPDPRDASASENFNAEWSFMLWTFISLMTTLSNILTCSKVPLESSLNMNRY